ncbi:unnamed protein product [Rotaria sordida]|uniref:Uncharacterized protein n=1 Tax=Rotaria sordida TaxID=392033 RepID=A0A814DU40_9BILA|nr:unnamed protein product [Rotaria sordida]
MNCLVLLFIVFIFVPIENILSFPTPIHRSTKSTLCSPNACITEPAFCLCGFEESSNDSCCKFECKLCPINFTIPSITFEIGPLNFFPLNSFNFSGLNFSFLG